MNTASGKPVAVKRTPSNEAWISAMKRWPETSQTAILDHAIREILAEQYDAGVAAALAAAESSAERICKWEHKPLSVMVNRFYAACQGNDATPSVMAEGARFCPYCGGRLEVEEAK